MLLLSASPSTAPDEAEIQNFHAAVRRDLDVCRLQITMHHAVLIRVFERAGDLSSDRQHFGERNQAGCDAIRQRGPFGQFRHQRIGRSRILHAADGSNVEGIQRREPLRLALKASHALRQNLNRDTPSELCIPRAVAPICERIW